LALHGGPARAGLSLDGGKFVMTPPAAADTPQVSATQAECLALASSSPDVFSMPDLASQSGIAVGYGRVSIAPALTPPSTFPYVARSGLNQNTNPRLPAPGSYRQRLAWLVVVTDMKVSFGPGFRTGGPNSTAARSTSPPDFDYLIFVVDATTGSDALVYSEGQPSVTVPAEHVSVPWTLVSRSPDGFSGQVRATVQTCDGLPKPVTIDHARASLAVVVERPIGADCGTQEHVTLPLDAAAQTADLPENIEHAPLGPVITAHPSSESPNPRDCSTIPSHGGPPELACRYVGPGATPGIVRSVGEFDNNTTIHVPVDSVLYVDPLHTGTEYAALPVRSSDPAVLGPLDNFQDYEINAFRAWRPGHADLLVPIRGCTTTGGPRCASPWTLHVTIG
jgi:hypothetical protein